MIQKPLSPRFFFWFAVALFSWVEKDGLVASALSAPSIGDNPLAQATAATSTSTSAIPQKPISRASVAMIANGGVAVLPNFVPSDLIERMRTDAKQLKKNGKFRPDGLSNYAKGNTEQQGFTQSNDRQTFRAIENGGQQSWYEPTVGDYSSRIEFDDLLGELRNQLAHDLNRPTLLGRHSHEITYNWYEPGAKLGRHLDEHHEETKGPKGWRYPSRRSVTWLVYLNEDWKAHEGGALLCHPRSGHDGSTTTTNNNNNNNALECGPIGCHEGNLQVGWIDDHTPVYLDAFRESGKTALYSCKLPKQQKQQLTSATIPSDASYERTYWSQHDFDVPAQPIDFKVFLPQRVQLRFEQISTASKDPRFAVLNSGGQVASDTKAVVSSTITNNDNITNVLEVAPAGGTLVLFDSVTLPHSVLEVTGNRQRIAATGWFHEDSQFTFGGVV